MVTYPFLTSKFILLKMNFMTREIFTTEGVVLTSINHKDYDKIVTIYTKNEGLIKLYVNLSRRSLPILLPLITPLTKAEFQIARGRSEFFSLQDGTVLDQRTNLRNSFAHLQTAITLVEVLYKSQWPEEASPSLYCLLDFLLSTLPTIKEPTKILTIFYIKLLKHEGILQMANRCAECNKELKEKFRFKGEGYCEKDAPCLHIIFSYEEELLLQKMFALRDIQQLLALMIEDVFVKKVNALFEQNFQVNLF